jgi:hypothetical protein
MHRPRQTPRARAKATPRTIAIARREAAALDLRTRGATYDAIAREVGYTHASAARKAVMRALAEVTREPAEELIALEQMRLDTLLAALWPTATDTGNAKQARAVEMVLGIMERRAKLLGLDAPQRRVVEQYTDEVGKRLIKEIEAELDEGD